MRFVKWYFKIKSIRSDKTRQDKTKICFIYSSSVQYGNIIYIQKFCDACIGYSDQLKKSKKNLILYLILKCVNICSNCSYHMLVG